MKKSSLDCYSRICFKKTSTILFSVILTVAFSCTSALYIPDESQQTSATSLSEMQAGRKLYIQKCGGCHTLYLPEKYTTLQWQHSLDIMAPKVSLDILEKSLILKYLTKGN